MKTFKSFLHEQLLLEEPPAWHGSPHDHNKFELVKIGTGEGNAAYGWGLYFSSSREVAEYYRDNLIDKEYYDKVNARMSELVKEMGKYNPTGQYRKFNDPRGYELAKEYDELMYQKTNKKKFLYHVDLIPEEDEFLDWDLFLGQQSNYVKNKLKSIGIDGATRITEHQGKYYVTLCTGKRLGTGYDDYDSALEAEERGEVVQHNQRIAFSGAAIVGREIYNILADKHGSPEKASKYLLSIGIPGIKYIGDSSGVTNYVIFDDSLVKIKEKH